MGELFEYFSEHASYQLFDIIKFLDIQGCPTKHSAVANFKLLVEGIKDTKDKKESSKKARAFAHAIIKDNFGIFEQKAFIDYWNAKSMKLTRSKLKAAEIQQTMRQVQNYENVFAAESSGNEESEGSEYRSRDSTPSPSSSNDENQGVAKHYLVHDGQTYQYKLKENSIRWMVNNYDVSQAFFDYRDAAISKAEDLQDLNDHEQLALDGIMILDNGFVNTDIVDYEEVPRIFNDIDQVDAFKSACMKRSQEELVIMFANDLATRNINITAIQKYIKEYENKYPDDTSVCRVLYDVTNIYCTDYSTDQLNEATLVRDTIDAFFRSYFPNSPLTKSIGCDAMISDYSKRFTRLDPSLKNYGKRADFTVVSSKSDHILLSLEAKPNKTKHVNELVKLCRELKDSMKALHNDGYSGVIVSGILMKGNRCHVYCMDHVFDGLYRVVLFKSVNFPGDCYQMHQLLPIFPLFQKLQVIVHSSAVKLRNCPQPAIRLLDNIVSMHTPIIIRDKKRKLDKNNPAVQRARRRLF
ncbi:hypothetical protein BD408DRAFT_444169 [Parasitella parasitica]|nr:hypothetical protein BD408DRAFT_444169 [Parasitella parasitica]